MAIPVVRSIPTCVEGIQAKIEMTFLDCSLNMAEIYEGVELTPFCVQNPDVEYETKV
jgi:hypothetical protein